MRPPESPPTGDTCNMHRRTGQHSSARFPHADTHGNVHTHTHTVPTCLRIALPFSFLATVDTSQMCTALTPPLAPNDGSLGWGGSLKLGQLIYFSGLWKVVSRSGALTESRWQDAAACGENSQKEPGEAHRRQERRASGGVRESKNR